jgi:hypothetical protein
MFVHARTPAFIAAKPQNHGGSPLTSAGGSWTSQAAEKSPNAVIPSAARDRSWFECPQKEGFLVASLLGMTAILTFSATSSVQRKNARQQTRLQPRAFLSPPRTEFKSQRNGGTVMATRAV